MLCLRGCAKTPSVSRKRKRQRVFAHEQANEGSLRTASAYGLCVSCEPYLCALGRIHPHTSHNNRCRISYSTGLPSSAALYVLMAVPRLSACSRDVRACNELTRCVSVYACVRVVSPRQNRYHVGGDSRVQKAGRWRAANGQEWLTDLAAHRREML